MACINCSRCRRERNIDEFMKKDKVLKTCLVCRNKLKSKYGSINKNNHNIENRNTIQNTNTNTNEIIFENNNVGNDNNIIPNTNTNEIITENNNDVAIVNNNRLVIQNEAVVETDNEIVNEEVNKTRKPVEDTPSDEGSIEIDENDYTSSTEPSNTHILNYNEHNNHNNEMNTLHENDSDAYLDDSLLSESESDDDPDDDSDDDHDGDYDSHSGDDSDDESSANNTCYPLKIQDYLVNIEDLRNIHKHQTGFKIVYMDFSKVEEQNKLVPLGELKTRWPCFLMNSRIFGRTGIMMYQI